jgi:hypothetical protein
VVGGIGNQERTKGWEALPEQKLATRRGSLQVRADERERRTSTYRKIPTTEETASLTGMNGGRA